MLARRVYGRQRWGRLLVTLDTAKFLKELHAAKQHRTKAASKRGSKGMSPNKRV